MPYFYINAIFAWIEYITYDLVIYSLMVQLMKGKISEKLEKKVIILDLAVL